jgi:hypothetical protein
MPTTIAVVRTRPMERLSKFSVYIAGVSAVCDSGSYRGSRPLANARLRSTAPDGSIASGAATVTERIRARH